MSGYCIVNEHRAVITTYKHEVWMTADLSKAKNKDKNLRVTVVITEHSAMSVRSMMI